MKRSTQLIIVLFILLIALGAAFFLLDFRLMQAGMAENSNVATYSFSVSEETPLPLEQDLDLYVDGPPLLEEELVSALMAELRTNPYVRNVNLQEEPVTASADTVLVVEIAEPSTLFWSPVYARTVMTVDVAYASDGEVAWIEEQVVALASDDASGPVVRVRGEYIFDGNAYGLISGPGYASYLSAQVAQTVNQSLADTLAANGGN
jgi:uncharacterized protein (TIGR01732 family)